MAITPLADPSDVEKVLRPLTEGEEALAQGLLYAATVALHARVAGLDGLIAGDEIKAEVAKNAVVMAVRRVLLNPESRKQVSRTRGPFSESYTVSDAVASGALYIDEADLVGLLPSNSQVGTIRLGMGLG